MSFISWQYPFLLIITTLLYWRLPLRGRWALLLTASYFFYGSWDSRFLALIMTSTMIDFFCGCAIAGKRHHLGLVFLAGCVPFAWLNIDQLLILRSTATVVPQMAWMAASVFPFVFVGNYACLMQLPINRRFKAFLIFSILSNLSVLGFFKYFNFFADSASHLLHSMGFTPHWATLQILLPVGISFYTFQSLSYTIDVYRKKTEACENLLTFSAFLSFFPQLVAGPIERSHHLLPQIATKKDFRLENLAEGCRMILVGLFQKVFVADNCALLANYVFDPSSRLNAYWAILGVIAFAFQIYGDFAGYTNIARGSARFFGVELVPNFRFPYFSKSPSDFWSRWHISLSSWFRDYVYIPLGGNQGARALILRNLMITMMVAGLWHGASWMFVLWGVYHGLLLVLYRIVPWFRNLESVRGWKVCGSMVIMFVWILLGWVMFRSSNIEIFKKWFTALTVWNVRQALPWYRPFYWLALHVVPLLLLQTLTWKDQDETRLDRYNGTLRGFIYLLLFLITCSSSAHDQEFIYFQF